MAQSGCESPQAKRGTPSSKCSESSPMYRTVYNYKLPPTWGIYADTYAPQESLIMQFMHNEIFQINLIQSESHIVNNPAPDLECQ